MNIVNVLRYVQKLSNFDIDLTLHNLEFSYTATFIEFTS
jgi:hypothetical protein